MPNQSPAAQKTDLVTFTISIEGKEIASQLEILSVRVIKTANKIPIAKIKVGDGSPDGSDSSDFETGETKTFVPGNTIEIKAGYHNQNKTIFKGLIIKQRLSVTKSRGGVLIIECRDEAIKMTVGRNNAYYLKKSDADIIKSLISKNKLSVGTVDSTKPVYPEIVQYYATDWDFMLTRADHNALIVLAEGGKISAVNPSPNKRPKVLELTYGVDIIEFDGEVDANTQLSTVESKSWDYEKQAITDSKAKSSNVNSLGNLTSPQLAGVMAPKVYNLQTTVPLEKQALQTWSDAQILKSEMAKVRGQVKFQGSASVTAGDVITLVGLSSRFNGDALVGGVVHTIEGGNWTTEATIGLDADWFSSQPDIISTPAAGLLPAVQGLQNGVVKQIDKDPDKQFRVLVEIPILLPKGEGVWARLSNIYATNKAGEFFYPEIGDEVVLGFFNDDPRSPVILGSLYSTKHAPPFTPDKKNKNKALVTKAQLKLVFDDEKKNITLETPGKNTVIISDEKKSITLKDQNSNEVKMSPSGINITSSKSINIKAKTGVTIDGGPTVNVKASTSASIKATKIDIKANAQLNAEGSATATLKAGGMTTIKGGLVKIN